MTPALTMKLLGIGLALFLIIVFLVTLKTTAQEPVEEEFSVHKANQEEREK